VLSSHTKIHGFNAQLLLQQALEHYALPINELKILLCHATGWTKTELLMRTHEHVSGYVVQQFHALATERKQGYPVAYLLGNKEFYSRTFTVNPACLIPRPETEELIDIALPWLHARHEQTLSTLNVLDVGTGSGAIAISLALEAPFVNVVASDISEAAIECAKHNAKQLDAPVEFFTSDYLKHIPKDKQFDLIISNPPYIAKEEPHLEQGDLRFEPRQALTDEANGLSAYDHLSKHSQHYLAPAGMVLVEHGYKQQEQVMNLFHKAGFSRVKGHHDLSGHPRMVSAILS
jgi:release factor glutamine methyltransferase